ncbi:hypothetical protein JCM5296_002925 [Sporobolomyces johnsonii]
MSSVAPSPSSPPESDVYDLLGIGFGPAAVAIAIALSEHNSNAPSPSSSSSHVRAPQYSSLGGLQQALGYDPSRGVAQNGEGAQRAERGRPIKAAFVEKHDGFKWHPGMMLEGSRMQISFLKDLATLRNPQSPYTFLSYLASFSPSRLVSFISLSTFTPTRREFADYLQWCAQKVEGEINARGGTIGYGEEVVAVEALLPDEDEVKLLKVTSRRVETGEIVHRFTRNLVVSAGGSPKFPPPLRTPDLLASKRVLHTSSFLEQIESVLSSSLLAPSSTTFSSRPIRLAVIGGGQSATECFLALRSKLSALLPQLQAQGLLQHRPQIDLLIRKAALRPTDEGAFSNEVFDPAMSAAVYGLEGEKRQMVLDEARNTNYSIVNPVTLEAVYDALYSQKVEEDVLARTSSDPIKLLLDPKLTIHPYTNILSASTSSSGAVSLDLLNIVLDKHRTVEYDAVVCGTGYDRQLWRQILFPSAASASGIANEEPATVSLTELFSPTAPALHAPTPSLPSPPLELSLSSSAFDSSYSSSASLPSSRPLSTTGSSSSSSSDDTHYFRRCLSTSGASTSPSTPPVSHPSASRERAKTPSSSREEAHDYPVGENYRLQLPVEVARDGKAKRFKPTVWLQGSCEKSHGISDSLLSVLAVRSGEVVSAMLDEAWFGADEQ